MRWLVDRRHGSAGVLTKSVQRRHHDWRRRAHAQSLNDRCPMTSSSRCQPALSWCSGDKVADSATYCRRPPASFWTPAPRHVTKPSLFATPTSGMRGAPTYDFVFDVDTAQCRSRHYFRSPCCPPSCHVIDDARSPASSSPAKEVVLPLARAQRYVEGNADDGGQPPEVNCG